MNWKPRLLVYLLLWAGFGIVCSVLVAQTNFDEERYRPSLWIIWAFLPFFLFVGLNDALGPWYGGFPYYLCAFGLLLVAHGWYWFAAKSMGVWVALYWIFLFVAVVGTWGFRQYLSGLDS